MNYTSAHSPRWSNSSQTAVNLAVVFSAIGEVPFCASPDDVEAHGREIFNRAVSGDFGVIAGYVAPVVSAPAVVSFFQGCAALQMGGYLEAVEAYMTGPATAVEKLAWRTITEIRRNSPLTSKLAAMLGLTEAQVDDLFILAATIEA